MLKVENLTGGYSNTPIIRGLNLEINKGEFFVLLGPNGSGKTTLFKLLTGQLPIRNGKVHISGQPLSTFTKVEKAKKIAVLTQEVQISFDYTVEEIVSLGRYPYQKGILKRLSKRDLEVIDHVMEILKVKQFRRTSFRMLSGGEKQRVLLAKALAQEPEILMLDEPTNHLDIKHTFQMLDLLKEWQHTKGLTIFAILHDLNVAALYADRVALFHQGSFLDVGDVNTLRKEEQLQKVYEVQVKAQSHPTIPKPQLLMTPKYADSSISTYVSDSFNMNQNEGYIHIQFDQPFRTLSNAFSGEGIQWLKHFCIFHDETNHDAGSQKEKLKWLMKKYDIPLQQTVGVVTMGRLEDTVIVKKQIGKVQMAVLVTVELSHVRNYSELLGNSQNNNQVLIHTMVFLDGSLVDTDRALVNAYMSATEAKMMAMQNLPMMGSHNFQLTPTESAKDCLVVAVRQQGKPTEIEEITIRKGIKEIVRQATIEAVQKSFNRVGEESLVTSCDLP